MSSDETKPAQPKITRVRYTQHTRESVYCLGGSAHLTITDPHRPYSGDEHRLSFSECDCAGSASTLTGEADNEQTEKSPPQGESNKGESAAGAAGVGNDPTVH